jgi:hypothetical protein
MTRVYCVLFWLILSVAPAWADLSLGIVPAKDSLISSKQQAAELASYLEAQLQEPVQLRLFNSESLLHQWLNRYREVDIAFISKAYHDSKRRGEFIFIVDYQPIAGSSLKPGTLVGRRGLPADTLQRLRDLLFVMDTDQTGNRLLKQMQVESFSAPGTRVALAPTPAQTRAVKTRPAPVVTPPVVEIAQPVSKPQIAAETAPLPVTPRLAQPQVVEEAVNDAVVVPLPTPAEPAVQTAVAVMSPQLLEQPTFPPATEPQAESHAESQVEAQAEATPPATIVTADKLSTLSSGDTTPYSRKSQQEQIDEKTGSGSGRKYLIAIAVVLLAGAGIKLFLIYQRRPRQRPAIPSSNMLIQHDWSELHQGQPVSMATTVPVEPVALSSESEPQPPESAPLAPMAATPAEPSAASFNIPVDSVSSAKQGLPTGQLQLDGNLGPRQIPAMLQLIAASGQSGTLTVTASHNEKCLTFSRGKITTASSRNINTNNQSGFLMNKLGYLLVRQGKISEEQRDQALIMCEGDSNLRLGEALLKMGAIKKVELQKSLCDQAKMILHSLIVFPEGRFEFTAGDAQITPEDNLRLSVNDFLKEAAAHQNEWRNIREMIPSLDTVLEFAPGGQDKVSNGRMTVHQKFVLSLVDGKKPIRDVCIAATMLDYELYRFLYLMTKANILQRAAA